MPTVKMRMRSLAASRAASTTAPPSVSSPSVSSTIERALLGAPSLRALSKSSIPAWIAFAIAVPPTGMSSGVRSRQKRWAAA